MKDKLLNDNFISHQERCIYNLYYATDSEYEEKYYETILFKYLFLELETSL